MRTFLEFFAGGGMARAGLGAGWNCLFANDMDPSKAAAYRANWGDRDLRVGDVSDLTVKDIPGRRAADLAWASFPCQDLSLAGGRNGLDGGRSSAFWPFWRLMQGLREDGRAPRMIVLENVAGLLTSNGGRDFAALGDAIRAEGLLFGGAVIDAAHFTPQSRPRLFIAAFHPDAARGLPPIASGFEDASAEDAWAPAALIKAVSGLSEETRQAWRRLPLPPPPLRNLDLADIVEEEARGVVWHTPEETATLLAMMTPVNHAKIEAARARGAPTVGAVFRRTRREGGETRQRAEARFDGLAGCLRTPAGGSSRQTLLFIDGAKTRSRLLSPREAARLMGLPDDYRLPERLNPALRLMGDGVAPPAVRFIAENVLEPLVAALAPA